ncbi:MAG: glycosyl transferase [Lachnospiraceae bacterium]|nr:glycosyl transferase [Lachnospiraceae bacterium]
MENSQKIPKIIHYFWFGNGEQDKTIKKYIKGWKKICPDYEIKLWNESNFDVNDNRFCREAYENRQWAFVSDYARLKVLYEYGGIQLDTDVEVLKKFDDLLGYEGFIGFESEEKVNDGQAFGVMPHHPIIKEMLELYDDRAFAGDDGSFNLLLSPEARTEILLRHGLKLDGSRQNVADIEVFPADYFCPMDFLTRKVKITENTYSIHHFAASWHSDAEKKVFKRIHFFCGIYGKEKGFDKYHRYIKFRKKVKKFLGIGDKK